MSKLSKTIEIGDKPLKDLNEDDFIVIAKIEGVHFHFDYWGELKILSCESEMFKDTITVDMVQTNIDGGYNKGLVLFLHIKDFTFHFEDRNKFDLVKNDSCNTVFSIKTIKYLISKGYDVPLY